MFNAIIIGIMAALSLIIGAKGFADGNLAEAVCFTGFAVGYCGLAGIYAAQ